MAEQAESIGAPSRRGFLLGAAGIAGVAAATSVLHAKPAAAAPGTAEPSLPAPGVLDARMIASSFYCTSAGFPAGYFKSFSGGVLAADVVTAARLSGETFERKSLGAAHYTPFLTGVAWGAGQAAYDWVNASLAGASPRSFSVVGVDGGGAMRAAADVTNGLVRSIRVPTVDSTSTATGYLAVEVSPARTAYRALTGTAPVVATSANWVSSHFRVAVSGLDATKVSRIDGFEVRIPISNAGNFNQAVSGATEYPLIRMTMPLASAAGWIDWHNRFNVRRESTATERSGSISFLTSNFASVRARLDLFGLGIVSVSSIPSTGKFVAELYCERMALVRGTG